MRTLKYAILGLCNRSPITGYDISKEFNSNAFSNFWYAKHSQIYPELKKLVEEGLLNYEVIIQGEIMEKKLYSITPAGEKELLDWLIEDEPLAPTPKDVFRLRAYFCDFMSEEESVDLFEKQLQKHIMKKTYLSDIMNKYKRVPKKLTPEFGDYIVLDCAIMREESYIAWVRKCLNYLKK